MSLKGKDLCLVEYSKLVEELRYIAELEYKVAKVVGYFSLPEKNILTSHDAAIVHLTKETRSIDRDMQIIRSVHAEGFPLIVIVSLLTPDDFLFAKQVINTGASMMTKHRDVYLEAFKKMNEMI